MSGKRYIGMYYRGNAGNDQIGYYLLMINVEQPVDGILDYEKFLSMVKSLRIDGKNSIQRLWHSIVVPVTIPPKDSKGTSKTDSVSVI